MVYFSILIAVTGVLAIAISFEIIVHYHHPFSVGRRWMAHLARDALLAVGVALASAFVVLQSGSGWLFVALPFVMLVAIGVPFLLRELIHHRAQMRRIAEMEIYFSDANFAKRLDELRLKYRRERPVL